MQAAPHAAAIRSSWHEESLIDWFSFQSTVACISLRQFPAPIFGPGISTSLFLLEAYNLFFVEGDFRFMDNELDQNSSKIAIFKGKQIRKVIHQDEWWFVVKDVIDILTDTVNSTDYIKKMRERDSSLSEGWGQIVTPLPIDTPGGKQRLRCQFTGDCSD